MAQSQALVPLTFDELDLAGYISICIGPYNSADSRKEAMGQLLALAYQGATEPMKTQLANAARASGYQIEQF